MPMNIAMFLVKLKIYIAISIIQGTLPEMIIECSRNVHISFPSYDP